MKKKIQLKEFEKQYEEIGNALLIIEKLVR